MTLRACWMVFLLICITQILDLENEEMTVEFKHCSSTNFSLPASEPLKKNERNPPPPVFSTVYRLFLSYFSICIKMTDGQLRFGTWRFSKRGRGAGAVQLQLTLRGGDDIQAKDEIPKEWSAMVNSSVFLWLFFFMLAVITLVELRVEVSAKS